MKTDPSWRKIERHIVGLHVAHKNHEAKKLMLAEVEDFMNGTDPSGDLGVEGYVAHSNFYRYKEFHQYNPYDEDDWY